MASATFLSLHLARFDALRPAGTIDADDLPGTLFCNVAADTRAAATEAASQQAYTFLILGMHAEEASAHRLLDERRTRAPWLDDAREVWGGVLRPFRHKGAANHLDPRQPGPLFETLAPSPAPSAPFVALTTVGWETGDGLDRNRVKEFGAGVAGVRIAMTAIPGLHSQQSFFFPGVLTHDPLTVTFWRDDASVLEFAYRPGVHRDQMTRYREENLADRTSFTRCIVLRSEGTWYGTDPQNFSEENV